MELVRRKLVETRAEAQRAIASGRVRVGTNPAPKAATMVAPDEPVHLTGEPERFVSRAGHKLEGALDTFEVDVIGRRAIDVGASTGGFTDCLLQRGASSVVAVDVGYGQMHWRIREHPDVTVVERTNIRLADTRALGSPFDVVVADLSFISLGAVAHALADLGGQSSDWVLLIKPQFEAGKDNVGKGGIVKDPGVWGTVLTDVVFALAGRGLVCRSLAVSSIRGSEGNVEFVGHFRRDGDPVSGQDIEEVVASAAKDTS